MPSAFRRAGATPKVSSGNVATASGLSPSSLLGSRGVKPWAGGIHLTSVGLNDLDVILGGGQPLGSCILLREDRWTRDLAHSLLKYWTAEAISQEQCLVIPVTDNWSNGRDSGDLESLSGLLDDPHGSPFAGREEVREILLTLPRNLHWDKRNRKNPQQSEENVQDPHSLTILEEEEEDDEEVDGDEGLKVAWQYKKSVQEKRLGLQGSKSAVSNSSELPTDAFCHSYDLSGRMNDQRSIDLESHLVGVAARQSTNEGCTIAKKGVAVYQDLIGLLHNTKAEGKAIRLLLFHVDPASLSIALPLLLVYIRQRSLPVVVLVCSEATIDLKSWFSLSRTADVVLSTEGFASRMEYPPPAEFGHLQGLLTISKVSTVTAATANGGGHFADLTISKRPAAFIYGFKRDRRKLHIPLLHIPPEDYAEGGGTVTSGIRSGAGKTASDIGSVQRPTSGGGMGCSSNMAGSVLEF